MLTLIRNGRVLDPSRSLDAKGDVIGRFMASGVRPKFWSALQVQGIQLDPELFRPPVMGAS